MPERYSPCRRVWLRPGFPNVLPHSARGQIGGAALQSLLRRVDHGIHQFPGRRTQPGAFLAICRFWPHALVPGRSETHPASAPSPTARSLSGHDPLIARRFPGSDFSKASNVESPAERPFERAGPFVRRRLIHEFSATAYRHRSPTIACGVAPTIALLVSISSANAAEVPAETGPRPSLPRLIAAPAPLAGCGVQIR